MGTGIGDVCWHDIEVLQDEKRRPTLRLTGRAASLADESGLHTWAISLAHGLTNDCLPETITDRAILKMGQKVLIVADHTKFDRVSTVHVAPVEDVDTIITDKLVPAGYIEDLRSRNVELIVV